MKFKLVHKETGLTLREYAKEYEIEVSSKGERKLEWFGDERSLGKIYHGTAPKMKYFINENGLIGFYYYVDNYPEMGGGDHIYFLPRDQWKIVELGAKTCQMT